MEVSRRSKTLGLSGIREIYEKAQKIPNVIRLEFGEPDFDTPDNIKSAAIEAIKRGATKYSSSSGIPELRKVVADKLKVQNSISYDSSTEVIITAGATPAIHLALVAILDQGEEILVPDPGWASYAHSVMISGAKPVPYALKESSDYAFEREKAEKLISDKTKAILINTPSNPMGSVLSRKNLQELSDFALEHKLFVLSDEVYEKFVYQNGIEDQHVSIGSLSEMKEKTVTINALSKTYSMTGWRIGYAAAPEPIISAMTKINAAENSCVSTFTQYAAVEALTGSQDSVKRMISAFEERRNILVEGLNKFSGFNCPIPKGAFYAFPNIQKTGYSSKELALKIVDEAHVAVVPGSAFGKEGEGYLRIAYANSIENIKEALVRIGNILK